MKRRGPALLLAILMVGGALFVRARLDGDDGGGSGGGQARIACITELAAICRQLQGVEVVVEDPAATISALRDGTADLDGWITVDPWPAIADIELDRQAFPASTALASTAIALAMPIDRADAITPFCEGTVGWRCVIGAVGNRWDNVGGKTAWNVVKVGLPPRQTAIGLVIAGAAVQSYFGPDYAVATNDFTSDALFQPWFASLKASMQPADPFGPFIQQLPALYGAVGTITAGLPARAGVKLDQLRILPSGDARAVVVLAQTGKRAPAIPNAGAAFQAAGWELPAAQPVPTGLPAAGVLLSLRDR